MVEAKTQILSPETLPGSPLSCTEGSVDDVLQFKTQDEALDSVPRAFIRLVQFLQGVKRTLFLSPGSRCPSEDSGEITVFNRLERETSVGLSAHRPVHRSDVFSSGRLFSNSASVRGVAFKRGRRGRLQCHRVGRSEQVETVLYQPSYRSERFWKTSRD